MRCMRIRRARDSAWVMYARIHPKIHQNTPIFHTANPTAFRPVGNDSVAAPIDAHARCAAGGASCPNCPRFPFWEERAPGRRALWVLCVLFSITSSRLYDLGDTRSVSVTVALAARTRPPLPTALTASVGMSQARNSGQCSAVFINNDNDCDQLHDRHHSSTSTIRAQRVWRRWQVVWGLCCDWHEALFARSALLVLTAQSSKATTTINIRQSGSWQSYTWFFHCGS